jgi:hypothetical protein
MEVATMTLPSEEYRLIPLTQGQFAKVSPEDYDWLTQWGWYAWWCPSTHSYYALRRRHGGKPVRMHRIILGLESGDRREGDHQNKDTLDNRRSNIRIADRSQNRCNIAKLRNNRSGFKGVYFHKGTGLYSAQIQKNKKRIYLGYRKTAEEAHQLYCAASETLHKEFRRIS